MWSASAVGAVVAEDSIDLHEISDNRLRFKEGKHGKITARFIVTEDQPWRKIRITYRRPGENLRPENYVLARLMQISRASGETEVLFGISSHTESDSDEVISVNSPKLADTEADYHNFYYYVEVEMRRKLFFPGEIATLPVALSSLPHLALYAREGTEIENTPSVPIPPPSEAEIAAIEALRSRANELSFAILTPAPELIAVALSASTSAFVFS